MTAAYDLFVKELTATGRDRLDGLSIYNLADLSESERPAVRQALTEAFARRDARVPRALAFVAPDEHTRALLQSVVQTWVPGQEPELFVVDCAAALLTLIHDGQALDLLVQQARECTDLWQRSLAEEGLTRATPATPASARLAKMIRDQPSGDRALSWADALLQRHGWFVEDPATQEEAVDLLNSLTEGDAKQRDAALLKVLQAPVVTWPRV